MSRARKDKVDSYDFNLFAGGFIYELFLFFRITTPSLNFYKRRVLVLCCLTWLPLLLFTIIEGVAFSGVEVPFLEDVDAHVRFLISLPLLIYGEMIVNMQLKAVVKKFFENKIIAKEEHNLFNHYIILIRSITKSNLIEIIILLFVIFAGHYISSSYLPIEVTTWYAPALSNVTHQSVSTYWYFYISLPIFQFLLLRWYYHIIVWYWFLWRVSFLRLRLNSLHPDQAGGLGFLSYSIYAFIPFLLAHTVLLTGMIFNRIWHTDALLNQFQPEVITLILFLVLCPIIPLIFFTLSLIKTKIAGTLTYQSFAQAYVNHFRKKWLIDNKKEMLGSTDIQSLSDLSNSYLVTAKMRITPFSLLDIMQLTIATALPLLPLILVYMPIDKIVQLINVIF